MSTKTLLTVLAVSVVYASTVSAQPVSGPLTDQASFTADQLAAWVLEANPGLAAIQAALPELTVRWQSGDWQIAEPGRTSPDAGASN